MLDSEAFGPLCAELRRAEANGIHPEQTLPRLVAARSMVGAVDVASVLHGRLSRYVDATTAERRVRTASHYTLGLVPQISDRLDPAMAQAIDERMQSMRHRADDLFHQALRDHESSTVGLGPRPADRAGLRWWEETGLAVAAYRDTWNVTGAKPLGEPSSLIQRRDMARIATMLTRQPGPSPSTASAGTSHMVSVQAAVFAQVGDHVNVVDLGGGNAEP